MGAFSLTVAGHTAHVRSLFESTPVYLSAYVTENGQPVHFSQSAAYQAMQEEMIAQEKAGVTNVAHTPQELYSLIELKMKEHDL